MQLAFLLYKYFPYGGMQRDFRRFVEESQKRGHACRVYYISWQGEELADADLRRRFGASGREWVADQFSFNAQAIAYQRLFDRLGCVPSSDVTRLYTEN